MSKRSQEILEQISSTCLPRINDVTVPILGIQQEKIIHDRTGVLYQIGERHFVLTAAHKLRRIVENNIPLYLSANAENTDLIPLAEALFNSTEENDRDVAAIFLPPSVAHGL